MEASVACVSVIMSAKDSDTRFILLLVSILFAVDNIGVDVVESIVLVCDTTSLPVSCLLVLVWDDAMKDKSDVLLVKSIIELAGHTFSMDSLDTVLPKLKSESGGVDCSYSKSDAVFKTSDSL